mgnify:CR=1 FL=1
MPLDRVPAGVVVVTDRGEIVQVNRWLLRSMGWADQAARLVSVLPSELRAVASSVRIDSGTSTLSLVLDMGGAQPVVARLGDSNALDDKLARLLQAVRNGLGAVCQVDVSTSEVGLTPC